MKSLKNRNARETVLNIINKYYDHEDECINFFIVLRHFMVIWFLNNNALYNRLVRPEFLNNFFIKCGFASNYFMYMRL